MREGRKRRIFVGIYEVGDLTLRLAQGFRKLGFTATNIVWETHSTLLSRQEKHDKYIRRTQNALVGALRLLWVFLQTAWSHDVFIFNFSHSFTSYLLDRPCIGRLAYCDLALLRVLGKKIVIVCPGCDVRHYEAAREQARRDGYKHCLCDECTARESCSLILKEKRVRKIERYADYVFCSPLSNQLFRRPTLPVRLPIKLDAIPFKINADFPPLIVHAPSNPELKGTRYVKEVIARLKLEGCSFKSVFCENMDHEELMTLLGDAQVVITQLLIPAHGLLELEAMAAGNVVLGSAVPGQYGFPEDLPIITTTPDNLYKNLKMVLENPQLRVDKAREGRAYVERHHDYIKVAGDFLHQIGEA